jgi:hypothetical protein
MIRQQVGTVESRQDHTYGGCSIHFVVVIAKAEIFIADGRIQSERQDSATVAHVCLLLVFLLHCLSPLAAVSLLNREMSPGRFAGVAVGDAMILSFLPTCETLGQVHLLCSGLMSPVPQGLRWGCFQWARCGNIFGMSQHSFFL